MDEPTTELHLSDIGMLMGIADLLLDGGNSVVLIEHHLDSIRQADRVIDLGPEGGSAGCEVLFAGPPGELKGVPAEHHGEAHLTAYPGDECARP